MIWVTSEDEQLLQKAVIAMQDYLHISHFFNLRTQFSSAISYLCSVTPSLFEAASSLRSSSSQQPIPPLEGDLENDIRIWKCLNSLRLLLQSVSHYSTFLEKVKGSLRLGNPQEWKEVVDFLFWLDARCLLPPSPTLLDITSPDNTPFPSCHASLEAHRSEERGLWTTLSSLFGGEGEKGFTADLQSRVSDVIQECGVEELFTRSNRIHVNSWMVLFKSLLSTDHALRISSGHQSPGRLVSMYQTKLHWLVLLLSKNTDRIGLVWGLVVSFFERVRGTAVEMDFQYVLERLVVEIINLTSIIISKPQLREQAFALLSLLEPIPPHPCISTRRVTGVRFLLPALDPALRSPSKWASLFDLLLKDARNDLARPLVWQTLCQLLQEKKISTINFVPVLKCCLQTSSILCFALISSRWISRSPMGSSSHRVPVLLLFSFHVVMLSPRISLRRQSLHPMQSLPASKTCPR